MSDRIFAALWLAMTAFIAVVIGRIEVPFSYEPIGPRAFPWLLCAMMAAAALYLLVKPDAEPGWPRGRLLAKSAVVIAALFAYAFAFEWLGFPAATVLATIAVGRAFGGSWVKSAVAGVALGAGLWFFFDRLLEVTLPLGLLWG